MLWKGSTNDGRFDLQDGTQLTPGDVVLMHFRPDLLVDLQKVFEVCKQQGFAIASLQDYLPALGHSGRRSQMLSGLVGAITSAGSSRQRSGCTSM